MHPSVYGIQIYYTLGVRYFPRPTASENISHLGCKKSWYSILKGAIITYVVTVTVWHVTWILYDIITVKGVSDFVSLGGILAYNTLMKLTLETDKDIRY